MGLPRVGTKSRKSPQSQPRECPDEALCLERKKPFLAADHQTTSRRQRCSDCPERRVYLQHFLLIPQMWSGSPSGTFPLCAKETSTYIARCILSSKKHLRANRRCKDTPLAVL